VAEARADLPPGAAPQAVKAAASAKVVEVKVLPPVLRPPSPSESAQLGGVLQQDAPPCPTCGCITVRNGACYKCLNCGSTTGCS